MNGKVGRDKNKLIKDNKKCKKFKVPLNSPKNCLNLDSKLISRWSCFSMCAFLSPRNQSLKALQLFRVRYPQLVLLKRYIEYSRFINTLQYSSIKTGPSYHMGGTGSLFKTYQQYYWPYFEIYLFDAEKSY